MMNPPRQEPVVSGPGSRSPAPSREPALIGPQRDSSRRVLFVGEAVTLAHVARPMALASKLVDRGYRPVVAADPRFAALLPDVKCERTAIQSIPTRDFLRSLARGS